MILDLKTRLAESDPSRPVESRRHQGCGQSNDRHQPITYCEPMDRAWMREKLEAYLNLLNRYDFEYDNENMANAAHDDSANTAGEMSRREPTVRQILKTLDPELSVFEPNLSPWGLNEPSGTVEAWLNQANIH